MVANLLSSSSNGERPTIDRLVTLHGEPKHTGECIPQKDNYKGGGVHTNQAVPVDLRVGSRSLQSWVQGLVDAHGTISTTSCTYSRPPGGEPGRQFLKSSNQIPSLATSFRY
jgi:hypothetical protein